MSLSRYLRHIINKSPRENLADLRARLSGAGPPPPGGVEAVMASAKHMDPGKLIDRLFRYQRVIANRLAQEGETWPWLEFEGRRVLEVGSGPLLGWGPLAVYLGCTSYTCVEPTFEGEILASERVWRRYFRLHYLQLEAVFGRRMGPDAFQERILRNIQVLPTSLEEADLPASAYDLVLTNSVLEHVMDLDGFFGELRRVLCPDCRHFHAMDFGNHAGVGDPFEGLYDLEPAEYFRKKSDFLNLKRPSELVDIFARSGLEVSLIPYYTYPNYPWDRLALYWQRFSREELCLRVGFFVSSVA